MQDDEESSSGSAASSSGRESPESCVYALQDPVEKKYTDNQSQESSILDERPMEGDLEEEKKGGDP